MSGIVILGSGLSGTLAAYELVPKLRPGDQLTLVAETPRYHFVPSNPWVAIGWREARSIQIDLTDVMRPRGAPGVSERESHRAGGRHVARL